MLIHPMVERLRGLGLTAMADAFILNPAVVLVRTKDLARLCNCGLLFRLAQGGLAGSADGHAGTDAALR